MKYYFVNSQAVRIVIAIILGRLEPVSLVNTFSCLVSTTFMDKFITTIHLAGRNTCFIISRPVVVLSATILKPLESITIVKLFPVLLRAPQFDLRLAKEERIEQR